MVVIFFRIDIHAFIDHLKNVDVELFVLALLFFVPQVVISAERWRLLIKRKARISFWESVKLVLASNALNILLPSRVGDLSKGYFVRSHGELDIRRGMNLVIFEKYIDLLSLSLVMLTGVLLTPTWDQTCLAGLAISLSFAAVLPILYFVKLEPLVRFSFLEKGKILPQIKHFLLDTQDCLKDLKGEPGNFFLILSVSLFLWFVHVGQFLVIFWSLHSGVAFFHIFRLVPLAIFFGLIPITVAGVGTRDSAMIYLFSPYEEVALIVGIGLFSSLRYFVPGLLGLPFLNQYVVKEMGKE